MKQKKKMRKEAEKIIEENIKERKKFLDYYINRAKRKIKFK